MAEAILGTGIWYFNDPDSGRPISSGFVYVGVANLDPKIEANRVTVTLIQEDGVRVEILPSAQPLELGAGGNIMNNGSPVVVNVSDTVSVRVDDSLGAQKIYAPFYNESGALDTNEGISPVNGSFERDSNLNGEPDNWDVSAGSGGLIAVDKTNQSHGLASLKFTSDGSSNAGTATSDMFDILKDSDLVISFSYESSAVDTLNTVSMIYFDASGSTISTNQVYSESAANPLVFTLFTVNDTSPAQAVQAKIQISGVEFAGATNVGTSNFDDIIVRGIEGLSASGSFLPTLFGSTTAGSPIYAAQVGTFTKIGLIVYVSGSILITNKGGMTGQIKVGGFLHPSSTNQASIGLPNSTGYTVTTGGITKLLMIPSLLEANILRANGNGSYSGIADTDINNAYNIEFNGSYITDK